jgi:hypothetical protein
MDGRMSKEMWLRAHEELVAEYLEAHPGVSWTAAYELTAEHVNDRLADRYAAQIDQWRMTEKE